MARYRIGLIPGDGIGPEIIDEGVKRLDRISELEGFDIDWISYPYGADHYLETGELLPENALKKMSSLDSIYLGALGDPRCEPGILENGILLKLRFYMDQFVNLRPIKLLEGVSCPLRDPGGVDFTVVRENTEDFYVGIGDRASIGKSRQHLEVLRSLYSVKFSLDVEVDGSEIAYQVGVMSRKGAERIIRYAFDLAVRKKQDRVTAVDKANVLTSMYGFWREVFSSVAKDYPYIDTEFNFVDAITMWFVKKPSWYQVVVAPNMFGDIITDLGAMIQGGLGLAPGGNINPEGVSMFEPIHGSAPRYKGKNRANPVATIWAGALMLEELGEEKSSEAIVNAIQAVLKEGKTLTKDLGGTASTSDMGDAVAEKLNTFY